MLPTLNFLAGILEISGPEKTPNITANTITIIINTTTFDRNIKTYDSNIYYCKAPVGIIFTFCKVDGKRKNLIFQKPLCCF